MIKISVLLFFLTCTFHFCTAQNTDAVAQVIIPPGQPYDKSEEHQVQIKIVGISYSTQDIISHETNILTVPGVTFFDMVIQPDESQGYCDLRFSASSKEDFRRLLSDVFCRLQFKFIQINDSVFTDCQKIEIP